MFRHAAGINYVVRAGGLEAILNAMTLFPDTGVVQATALHALTCIFELAAPAISTRFIQQLGGVELVVKAMKDFPHDASIQGNGCFLFYFFAKASELREDLVKAGVVVLVATKLEHEGALVKRNAKNFMKIMFQE